MTAPPPLRLRIGPSPRLALALALAHGGALAAFVFSVDEPGLAALASVLLSASFHRLAARHAWRISPDAVVSLGLEGQGRWRVERRDGRVAAGSVSPGSVVVDALIALTLDTDDGAVHVVVPADGLDADRHRALRARLMHGDPPGPEPPGTP